MSEIASYSIQAVFFALLALAYLSKEKKIDSFSGALISFWTLGVIFIFAKYRSEQVQFYSNDQAVHQFIVENYIPIEGINLSSTISMRYVITLPAYFLAKFGFNIALIFKFMQLLCVLLITKHAKALLMNFGIPVKRWMFIFYSGPLLIFMSLLALRDVILAFFTLLFIFPSNSKSRYLALAIVGLLRPHLAAALLFGFAAEIAFQKLRPRLEILSHAFLLLISYAIGALSFPIGNYILNGSRLRIPTTIFSIEYFSQIGLNFVGLQFLVLDGENTGVVAAGTSSLLIARLLFVDTFLVPIVFFLFLTKPKKIVRRETLHISTSMFFFYGLVFQNHIVTNSTRQNLPFITVMGLIGVIRLCQNQITTRMISPNPEVLSTT